MKQLKTFVLSMPFVLAAVGCSQDELLPDGGKGTNLPEGLHEVEVTFNMGMSGGLQTRSITRPVISSDDWQRVTNVRIYVFRADSKNAADDGYFYCPDIDTKGYLYVSNFADAKKEWQDTDVWGDSEEEKNENETHTYSVKLKLGSGSYKFLAVGRDDIDESSTMQSPTMSVPDWTFSDYPSTFQEALGKKNISSYDDEDESSYFYDFEWDKTTSLKTASVMVPATASTCSEMFVGTSEVCTVAENTTNFSTSITMDRAVAGMLMYVKNIPVSVPAMEDIQEYSKNRWHTIIHKGEVCKVERVCILAARYNYEINMNTREAGTIMVYNENTHHFYTGIKISDMPNQSIEDGCYKASVLDGTFLLPQLPNKGGYTENDQMFNEHEKLEKSLYLVYTTLSGQGGEFPIWWQSIKIKDYNAPAGEDEYNYSLKANNFYSFGKKNIDKGEDDPIDLKPKGEEGNLYIEVIPDWDNVADLEWK